MKSPSSKKSCPKCGKKVFNITGHQKRAMPISLICN